MYTTPLGYQFFTPAQAATVVSLTVPEASYGPQANRALILGEVVGIRYRSDGIDPTPTVGFINPGNRTLAYEGDLRALRMIAQSGGTPTIHVLYYYVSGATLPAPLTPAGFQVYNTAALTPYPLVPPVTINGIPPRQVLLQATGAAFRFRDDGINPSSTEGFYINGLFIYEGDLSKVRLCNTTTGSIVNATYYV